MKPGPGRLRLGVLAGSTVALTMLVSDSVAYVVNGASWNSTQVAYYINTSNLDLAADAVESSVRAGADTWHLQSGAGFRFLFAGLSTQSTNTYDGINLVMFRNASSGSAIATTYWWTSGGRIIDADIVFWDGAFRFYAGTAGCSGGFYIEDIAAHEFGHALGLGHSASAAATMYPSTSSCSMNPRSLDADDISGIRFLYPPAQVPTPPTGLRVIGTTN
jgi:hypothetical protein